ncbi:MAG TPA: type II toxin-antitoxin system prevent-host-death family antitoxin [Verrucomicrobiales bacterium]|nr:type II toxin-antitoxin system prevent-host-death family antitoxin [Verrucomicrobiales bacterium]HIL70425.1 type II toxin-antitoxin system prevent-host-death family antitoxin [Verrucomicrobiota bacterium]
MKTATVRDLRNHYTNLLRWVQAGEEVLITQKGIPVARLLPPGKPRQGRVNWASSPEVCRDRSGCESTQLSSNETASIIAEAGGKW